MASVKHSMFRDLHAMDMASPHVVTDQDQDGSKDKQSDDNKPDNGWLT